MDAKMSFNFDMESWDSGTMEEYCRNIIDRIFPNGNESKIVVCVENTIANGLVERASLGVFDTYINALETINKFEYSQNTAVEVYEANKKGFAEILYKTYDAACYHRYSGVKFRKYSLSDMRHLFDTKAVLNVYEEEISVG